MGKPREAERGADPGNHFINCKSPTLSAHEATWTRRSTDPCLFNVRGARQCCPQPLGPAQTWAEQPLGRESPPRASEQLPAGLAAAAPRAQTRAPGIRPVVGSASLLLHPSLTAISLTPGV